VIKFLSPTVCNVTHLSTKELYKSKFLKKKEELMPFTSIFFATIGTVTWVASLQGEGSGSSGSTEDNKGSKGALL
jgi:hypothetical protein